MIYVLFIVDELLIQGGQKWSWWHDTNLSQLWARIGTVLHAAWVHFSYPESGNIFVLLRRFCLLFQAMQILANIGYEKCALHKEYEIGIGIMATIVAR
jgi:hypothetical protein